MKQDIFQLKGEYRNFTNEDLIALTDLKNHKAVYLGDGYYWRRLEKGKWVTLENLPPKKTAKKIYHFIHFNIAKWTEELTRRQVNSKTKRKNFYNEAELSRAKWEVSTSNLKNKDKIEALIKLDNKITANEIVELTYINKKTVYRIVKGLEVKSETINSRKVSKKEDDWHIDDDYAFDDLEFNKHF